MSDLFGDQFYGKAESLVVECVFVHDLGSAAVGTDAVERIVQAQNGAAAVFQLVVMSLGGQLLLGIAGSVEGEGDSADGGEFVSVAGQ